MYIENFDKNYKVLVPENTTGRKNNTHKESHPGEQKDSHKRKYPVLPPCPQAAVTVTTVTSSVLPRRRMVRHEEEIICAFILATFLTSKFSYN